VLVASHDPRAAEALAAARAVTVALEDPAGAQAALGDDAEATANEVPALVEQVTGAAERTELLAGMARALGGQAGLRLYSAALAAARAGTCPNVFIAIGGASARSRRTTMARRW
jgi:hypothetical protein